MKTIEVVTERSGISKIALIEALQSKWNATNGCGFLTDEEEFDKRKIVSEIEDFLVELGLLSRDDLKSLHTWGWRIAE